MEASRESHFVTKSTLALVTIKKQLKGEDPWQAAFVLGGGFRLSLCERFPTKPLWEVSDETFEHSDAEWVFYLHKTYQRWALGRKASQAQL